MPSISSLRRNEIIGFLEPFAVYVRTLPGISEIAQGRVKIADLLEVRAKDLLGRVSVPPNKNLLGLNIKGKVVMVTGAGGSIGSELSKQILLLKPKKLILFDHSELALYNIDKELTKIKKSEIRHAQLYLNIDSEDLIDVTLFIKSNENTKFRQLIDVTVVDYPENTKRFKVVYLFLSHEFNQRIILSFLISENEVIP